MDKSFESVVFMVEKKTVVVSLHENAQGRYVRIKESVGDRGTTIMIPSGGLVQLRDAIDKLIEADRTAGKEA